MKLPVHRIIPFSNVEGYGNRTSIFVQGCNANCLYCHNPETIPMSGNKELYDKESLLDVVKHQMPFIRGITVSGGEATLHPKFLSEFFQDVKQLGLTCYVDTNGFFDYETIKPLIDQTDKFLYDIKGLGSGLENLAFSDNFLDVIHLAKNAKKRFEIESDHIKNLKLLLQLDKIEEVRLVYLKNYYDFKEVVDLIYNILKDYPNVLFKVIKMHSRGLPKERLLLLKGAIPSTKDYDEVKTYVKNKQFNKVIFID